MLEVVSMATVVSVVLVLASVEVVDSTLLVVLTVSLVWGGEPPTDMAS
jgi:hypothetical protein